MLRSRTTVMKGLNGRDWDPCLGIELLVTTLFSTQLWCKEPQIPPTTAWGPALPAVKTVDDCYGVNECVADIADIKVVIRVKDYISL